MLKYPVKNGVIFGIVLAIALFAEKMISGNSIDSRVVISSLSGGIAGGIMVWLFSWAFTKNQNEQ